MPKRTGARNKQLPRGSRLNPAGSCARESQCNGCDEQPNGAKAAASSNQLSTGAGRHRNGAGAECETAAGGKRGRGGIRPLPVQSAFPAALPIAPQEIHMVLAALGPDLAALFAEDR